MNSEINMRNCGYSVKWRNGGGSDWCNAGCRFAPAPSGDRSNGMLPTSKTSLVMTRIERNSTTIMKSFKIYVYEIATYARTACCRHKKHHWRWPGNPNYRNPSKFMFTRMCKASRNSSSCYSDAAILMLLHNVSFLLSLTMAFVLNYNKLFLEFDFHRKTKIWRSGQWHQGPCSVLWTLHCRATV